MPWAGSPQTEGRFGLQLSLCSVNTVFCPKMRQIKIILRSTKIGCYT